MNDTKKSWKKKRIRRNAEHMRWAALFSYLYNSHFSVGFFAITIFTVFSIGIANNFSARMLRWRQWQRQWRWRRWRRRWQRHQQWLLMLHQIVLSTVFSYCKTARHIFLLVGFSVCEWVWVCIAFAFSFVFVCSRTLCRDLFLFQRN